MVSQPSNDPTLDADTKATLDTIADALAKGGRVDLPTQEGRPAQVFVVASVPGSRLAVDVEHTMHRVYDRVPVIVVDRQPDREWGDDLSASVRRRTAPSGVIWREGGGDDRLDRPLFSLSPLPHPAPPGCTFLPLPPLRNATAVMTHPLARARPPQAPSQE